jgi:two-component system, sensor histidine kinase YesM
MVALATLPVLVVTAIAAGIAVRSAEAEIVKTYSSRIMWSVQMLDEDLGRIGSLFNSLQMDQGFMEAFGIRRSPGLSEERQIRSDAYDALARALYANPGIVSSLSYFDEAQGKAFTFDYAAGAASADSVEGLEPWSRIGDERTSMFFSKAGKDGQLLACRAVRRFEDRELLGALAAKVDGGVWLRLLSILSPDDGGPVLVADASGRRLYGEGESSDASALGAAGISTGAGDGSVRVVRGARDMVFLASAFEGRILVAKAVPIATITQSARTTAAAGLWTGLFFACLSFGVAVFTSRRLSAPIVALAKRMSVSGIPEDIEPFAESRDEIAALERSFNAMLGRIRDLVDSEYRREIELTKARLDALQARINPHYLHNTLNLIGGIALARGVPEIHSIALAVGRTLRYASDEGEDLVPLEREIDSARDYLFIQEQRFLGRFSAAVDSGGEGAPTVLLPRLSVQPILENCFEHGFEGSPGSWRIDIKVRRAGTRAAVIIRDNGRGIAPDRLRAIRTALSDGSARPPARGPDAGVCLGLANVDARLKIHFGPECGIKIFSAQGKRTTVMLIVGPPRDEGKPCTGS